jgi:Rha family phage regulatory protein
MTDSLPINITPQIVVINGVPLTTSLTVAEHFGKAHKNVLRDIENVLTQVSDFFGKLNFEPTEYTATNNLGFQVKYAMYNLTRDGFMILVMGFTGKEAMCIKEAYITAFNEMEAMLNHGLKAKCQKLVEQLFAANPKWALIKRCLNCGLNQAQIARVLKCSAETVRQEQKKMQECGLLPSDHRA